MFSIVTLLWWFVNITDMVVKLSLQCWFIHVYMAWGNFINLLFAYTNNGWKDSVRLIMLRSSVLINSAERAIHFYSFYNCCCVLFILHHEYTRFILIARYGRKSLYSTVRLPKYSILFICMLFVSLISQVLCYAGYEQWFLLYSFLHIICCL